MINSQIRYMLEKKVLNRTSSIELVISEKCQNACSYCYRKNKHSVSSFYSMDAKRAKSLLDGFLNLFELDDTFYNNRTLELFGGDGLLDYKSSFDILRTIEKYKPLYISIPTNGRMITELSQHDIDKLLCSLNGTKINLSLSVDGSLGNKTRRLSKIGQMLGYDEQMNYDKLFKLSKKYHWGYHPMLPFEESDKWLELVEFFYNNYGIVPYLLEVRHPLSREEIIKSIKNLVNIRDFYEDKIKDYTDEQKTSILNSANTIKASRCPRGIGCSGLTTMYIMPNGDLPFCHRVIDPPWVMGNIDKQEFDISKLVNFRAGYDHRNHPTCMVCPIRKICNGLCQGACYEYWGDPFIPIESICNYLRLKAFIFSKHYKDWESMLCQSNTNVELLEQKIYNTFDKNIINSMIET